jgi:hypothetical protein
MRRDAQGSNGGVDLRLLLSFLELGHVSITSREEGVYPPHPKTERHDGSIFALIPC